ncbi:MULTISPECIES: hypothetical protein [Hyphobacterium]|uniref:Uncharacterized protein n=1 Tax=Hyphobacterium vulgare TaxID=1736751 RepID=A0ABV6ZZU5_9PROT
MKMLTPLFLTAGALALLVSTPSLGQSTETISLNYERITTQTQAGVEPDEIDNRATDAQATTAQSRRRGAVVVEDIRASDDAPQAGLLLPAVQNVQAQGNRPQPRTPVLLEVEDIEGETTENAAPANPRGTRPGTARPGRAAPGNRH